MIKSTSGVLLLFVLWVFSVLLVVVSYDSGYVGTLQLFDWQGASPMEPVSTVIAIITSLAFGHAVGKLKGQNQTETSS